MTVAVDSGTNGLLEAVRALDANGLSVDDLALRRPTLDEVFLHLTGRPADDLTLATTATPPPPATDRSSRDHHLHRPRRSSTARHDAGFLATTVAVAIRTVRKFVRTPQLIVVGSIQGAMFLLIFRYVFGGAIASSGVPYVDFLVPGFVATGVLFSGTAAAAGVAEDLEQGLFDRLRSLPIPRGAILAGRAVADTLLLSPVARRSR